MREDVKTNPGPEVFRAIELDDADRLKELLETGLSPEAVIRFHSKASLAFTPLEFASQKGAQAATTLLIKAGAKVNEGKLKPLIVAAMGNHVDTVKLLLDAGADPNIKWNDPNEKERGLTALMYAVVPPREPEMIELLLAHGADPNSVTDKGNSALSRAIAYKNTDAVNILLRSGCKPQGNALLDPVYRGEADLVRKLIAAGADINVMWNRKGETGHSNVLQGAVRLRGDNVTTLRSPLTAQRARFERVKMEADARFKIVQELVGAGAKVNRVESPTPPLYLAAARGDLETVKVLLQAGADPNPPKGMPGDSPLHAACRGGFAEIAECLVKAGADVKITNVEGRTALEELGQLTKSKEIENWERAIREGARIEPGMMETTREAWNRNRARLIELLESIPGSERRPRGSAGVPPVSSSTVPMQTSGKPPPEPAAGIHFRKATMGHTTAAPQKDSRGEQRQKSGGLSRTPAKETVESDESDGDFFDENLVARDYELPDGSWISLWIAMDTRFTEWSYFSIIPGTGITEIPETWYRVFRMGTTPPDWHRMEPIEEVYKRTGFNDDDEEKDNDEQGPEIGAAEKLLAGEYVLEAKVRVDDKEVELGSLTFTIK